MSIFSKLFKLFLAVVLMPLLPMTVLLAFYQNSQKDNILENHYNLAEVVASDLKHYAEDLNWRLSFASSVQKLLQQGGNVKEEFQKILAQQKDLHVLGLISQDGEDLLRVESNSLYAAPNRLTAEVLAEMAKNPRLYIAPFETAQGALAFEFVMPLKDGVFLYGLTELSDLADRLQQMRIGQTGQVFLVSAEGVLYSGASQWAPQISPEKLKAAFEEKSRLFKSIKGAKEVFVGGFSSAKPLGMYVAVLQLKDEAYRSLYFSNIVLLLFLLAIATLAYFGALTFSRSLGEPIAALAEGAKQVSQGHLDHRVKEEMGWGEFRELIASFNKMTADLKDYQALQLKSQVSEMKEHIFRSVAHDLRAPLLGLQGYIYILSSGKINAQEREEYLNRMKEAAQDLSSLLEDVLAVSRVQAGMTLPQRQTVELAPLLKSLIHTQEPVASEKGLSLKCEVPEELCAYADPKLLRRIVNNLLSNAIKFTAQGGIEVKAWEDEKQTFLSVKDSGIGLTEKACQEIFEKYRQVDESAEGYGLGLFISRQLAHAHGGDLTVVSVLGQGSTFTLSLPKEDA